MALVKVAHEASSSSTHLYDVFLSFRGEDTRKNFTDHLYTALTNAGFRTFQDEEELPRGEDIKPELKKAIQQSRSSVIVFSKDYASSGWCLEELAAIILQRKSTSNHVVLPVFYDIDPSHLRKQTGSVGKAFAKHQKKQSLQKLNRWREALTQVADLAGMVLQNQADGHEAKFIKKIVTVIEDKLHRVRLSVVPYLVGMQYRVKNINLWLQDGSSNVGICGICGVGGIGKTTIAQVVYNSNFERFEGSSFIENVREISEQPNGLVQIQKKLLSGILSGRKVKIQSVSEGIMKIKDAIGSKKVLLVLDDVDRIGQLDAVLRMRDCFCPGSKIIITTRHAWLLKSGQVDKVYNVETLEHLESFNLFSWHCFGKDYPTEGYVEVSERVVRHCGGLPVALHTLGSSLSGQNLDVWVSALDKLKAIPNREILSKLRISYDSLQDDHDQNLFLHIACFLIGKEKDVVVRILDGCDFYTAVGIQNLIDRCLVTIDENNRVKMHQMIRDMGKEIVRLESVKEPGKRSRLWHYKDSFNVLREKNGSEAIEGLSLDMDMYHANTGSRNSNEVVLETNGFTSMSKLRLLHLCDVHLNGDYQEFPKNLRWLCWIKFPLCSVPSGFLLESLVVLEMHYSSLKQAWKGTKCLPSLKILDLSHSHGLTETGDFSLVPNLERLILVDCASLVCVHESIAELKKLVYLNMKDCKLLSKLPNNIVMLQFLETIIISGCSNFNEFPMEMSKMESLKVLQVEELKVNKLLISATSTATGPGKPPYNFWACFPRTLIDLSLRSCNLSDDAFPEDFGNLPSLRSLNLAFNPICSLPDCVRSLTKLDSLELMFCKSLKSLVGLPRVSTRLSIERCDLLENITFQSHSCLPERITFFTADAPVKLVEIEYWYKLEPIGRVDVEMIKLLNLCNLEAMEAVISMYTPDNRFTMLGHILQSPVQIQGLYEYGIFSTFFPGNVGEVPGEFSHTSSGESSISFTLPLLSNHRIRGFNIYSVYANKPLRYNYFHHEAPVIIEVWNKSKGLKWIYRPSCYGIPSVGKDVIWLSHWNLGNRFEAGDKVRASVRTRQCAYEVKEWGIEIVYKEEGERIWQQYNKCRRDADHEEVFGNTGGDLFEIYEVMPGTYFLCGGPLESNRQNYISELGKNVNARDLSELYKVMPDEYFHYDLHIERYREEYTAEQVIKVIGESDEETDVVKEEMQQAEPTDRTFAPAAVAADEAEERDNSAIWRGKACKVLIVAAVFVVFLFLFLRPSTRPESLVLKFHTAMHRNLSSI